MFSPTSIGIALAMTREGATGKTAKEMDAVLGAGAGAEAKALRRGVVLRGDEVERPRRDRESACSAIRVDIGKAFLNVTGKEYGAPIEGLDFRGTTETARAAKINKWVEEQNEEQD